MLVKKFLSGPIGTNCYLLVNDVTKEAVVVDPASCPIHLQECVEREKITIKAILLTHAHYDHILGIEDIIGHYGEMPVYVHEKDKVMLENSELNMSCNVGYSFEYHHAVTIRDGQILNLAGYDLKVLHTPGHTPGGVCYYIASEGVLISGDTLFAGSVGRTDFPGGSFMDLIRSIREKVLVLPDDTHVYPGHMDSTSILSEKQNNPFI